MKIARYIVGGNTTYGIVDGDLVRDINGTPFEKYDITDKVHQLTEVKLLTPAEPRNLMTTGNNTVSHATSKQNRANPRYKDFDPLAAKEVLISIRSATSIIAHGDPIIRPREAEGITFREEVELVVVIGKQSRRLTESNALDHVLGYTVGNDLTVKEWEYEGKGWKAKCCDTMHPIGPWIETELDPSNVMLRARVNGVEVQSENTAGYIFGVPAVLAQVTRHLTLYPGDMIFMGTFGEPEDCKVGDVVEVEAEGVGVLRNPVIAEK